MPTYLWSGKDRYGNQIVQRLTTETVAQSKELLLERGYTDLILHTTATEIAMREPDSRPPEQTAEEELTMRNKGAFRWSELFTRTFKESPVLSVLLLAGLGLGVYRRDPWTTVLCSIALAWLYSVRVWLARPRYYFRKLNEAREWHRWDEMMHFLERLQAVSAQTNVLRPHTFARYRAVALAGRGRVLEGVMEFEKFSDDPTLPRWLYLALLGTIYETGGDFDSAIKCQLEAVAENPGNPTCWLDLAYYRAVRKRAPAEARAALEQALKLEIPHLAEPYVSMCHGFIAYEESDFPSAKRAFLDALTRLAPRARMHLVPGSIYLTQAWLCCVCAALGECTAAERYFRQCARYVRAINEPLLLQRCNEALVRCRNAGSPGI